MGLRLNCLRAYWEVELNHNNEWKGFCRGAWILWLSILISGVMITRMRQRNAREKSTE